jgi:hypothetical protein
MNWLPKKPKRSPLLGQEGTTSALDSNSFTPCKARDYEVSNDMLALLVVVGFSPR